MTVRLGDYVNVKTGKLDANAANEHGAYPFFTCSVEPLKINTYAYDCECALVAGNGDLNVKYYNGKFNAYQRTYIIESKDKSALTVPYLYRFLDKYVETLRTQSIGGVIKYIKLGNLTEARLVLPPVEEQNRIVGEINKISDIIEKHKQLLEKLDLLVRSRFVEMFGNGGDGCFVTLETVFIIRDDLRKPINEAVRSGMRTGILYPYYGANGQVDSINEYLMEGEAICLAEDCGAYGAGEASAYIVSGKCWVNNHAHVLFPRECCNIIFANMYFRITDLSAYVVGTTRMKLTQAKMKEIPILLPSLELQNEFARFVEQTERAKATTERSLEKAEMLKKALMQKYFG